MKMRKYLLFLFLPLLLFSQNNVILKSNGKIIKPGQFKSAAAKEIQAIDLKESRKFSKIKSVSNILAGIEDTLSWRVPPTTNFGFSGHDIFLQWFEAPADMSVNGLGYNIASVDSAGTELSVKLIKVNLSREDLINAGTKSWGYYEAAGNGFNDRTAFPDDSDRTGGWVDLTGTGRTDIFGETLWPDSGRTVTFIPAADGNYQWVDIDSDESIVVTKGTILGVVLENRGNLGDENRIGIIADNSLGIPGFKYYTNGRLDPPNDGGWWSREYTWDFALAVSLVSEPWMAIESVTDLRTTLSVEPRTVEAVIVDDNPSGSPAGIAFVNLYYSVNDNDFVKVEMTADGNRYTGIIPGQSPGSHIEYYVYVENYSGDYNESMHYGYFIFAPTSENLLVFNGFTQAAGYPQSYYFGVDDFVDYNIYRWEHDTWAFGELTAELLENYTNVFEITTSGPNDINNNAIRSWLEADGDRNYFLAGDEWLGKQSGWVDSMTHNQGDFQYDILGVSKEYNDINYAVSGDEKIASLVTPVQGSTLGDSLYALFSTIGDSMLYNPIFEVNQNNWLDGVNFLDDVEVDMLGLGKDGKWYPIGGHRTLPAGNKIVFLTFDPLSLDGPDTQYYWYGFSSASPQVQSLRWFGIRLTSVKKGNDVIPREFKLYQNYPNPFNPTTIIKYSIPDVIARSGATRQSVDVSLNIYDILGREVAALVNEKQSPGNYSVEFNAGNLPSGVYLYRLTAWEFSQTKKMALVK